MLALRGTVYSGTSGQADNPGPAFAGAGSPRHRPGIRLSLINLLSGLFAAPALRAIDTLRVPVRLSPNDD